MRERCPKCEVEGRKPCTRFHYVSDDEGERYIRCERKECGWEAEVVHNETLSKESREKVNRLMAELKEALLEAIGGKKKGRRQR